MIAFNSSNSDLARLARLSIFVLMLRNLLLWFFQDVSSELLTMLTLVIIFLYELTYRAYHIFPETITIFLISGILCIYWIFLDNVKIAFWNIATIVLCTLIYIMKDEDKLKLLEFITKWFSLILLISLIGYIINYVINIDLGLLSKPYAYTTNFRNGIVFLVSTPADVFQRFRGPFIEPGHLANACVFILFAYKYKLRGNRYLYVLLISVFLSFSLSGYILLIIGYLLSRKWNIHKAILSTVMVALPYLFITTIWDGGNNPVNTLILARLEYDENKGIKGNNRVYGITDDYFEKNLANGKLITGVGVKEIMKQYKNSNFGGAGYKIFFIQYGIIGALLVLMFYFDIAYYSNDKRFAFSFLVLMIICFLQRSYPFFMYWFVPYCCSMVRYPDTDNLSVEDTIK